MAKKLNFREILKNLNKEHPLSQDEIAARSINLKVEKKVDVKLGDFSSKRSLAVFEKDLKNRGKAKTKPTEVQEKFDIVEEVQAKERQSEDFAKLPSVGVEKAAIQTEIVSVGRMLKVVPSSSFGPSLSSYKAAADPSENNTFTKDALRGRMGSYWAVDDSGKQFEFVNGAPEVKTSTPYSINFRDPVDLDVVSDFGKTEEWVDICAAKKKFDNAEGKHSKPFWKTFVVGGKYDGSTVKKSSIEEDMSPTVKVNSLYFDHVHEMPLPFAQKDLEKMNIPLNGLSAEIKPEYNFYIKGFEDKIAEDSVLDNTLPNMYVFSSELNSENPNPDFKNFITLSDTMVVEDKVFTKKEGREKFDIKTHPIGQYYDLYSRQYNNVSREKLDKLSQKFSNILLSIDDVDLIKSYNEKREMFPMYVDVKISTDKTTTFAQMLKDTSLSNAFVSQVANLVIEDSAPVVQCRQSVETIIQNTGTENPKKVSTFSNIDKRVWDITTILAAIRDNSGTLDKKSSIYLADYENQKKSLEGEEYKFFKTLMFTIFHGKLQKLIKQKFRTFEQIMSGKPAYSETVMYRVAKFDGDANGKLLQNYFFPNSNEIDVLRFIDTQVKYDKKYSYVVYAYQLVIGNKYQYDDLEADSFTKHAAFKVEQEPSLMLYENEYFTFSGVVLDDPPIMPDINIVPYKGVDDKVLLLMNGNVGDVVMHPIAINAGEEQYFNKLRQERKIGFGMPIRFKADDHATSFEVYRTDFHPASYRDFEGYLKASVRTDVNLKSLQAATAASFVDKILPNKKYYYTFRATDNHAHFSNPSPVIRAELINENGTIFLLKEVVEFAIKEKEVAKPMRRYIQLVPNVLQTLIDEEKSGFADAKSASELKSKIHLGVADEKVWDKDFRVRLTSKSTGKKIDFKVRFTHKHEEKV